MNLNARPTVSKGMKRKIAEFPYEVEFTREDGYFCAFIPTLGRDLFHAYGETEDSALEVLLESFDDLRAWYEANIGGLPPPDYSEFVTEDLTEARGNNLGLQCIIWTVFHGAERIQPSIDSDPTVECGPADFACNLWQAQFYAPRFKVPRSDSRSDVYAT